MQKYLEGYKLTTPGKLSGRIIIFFSSCTSINIFFNHQKNILYKQKYCFRIVKRFFFFFLKLKRGKCKKKFPLSTGFQVW